MNHTPPPLKTLVPLLPAFRAAGKCATTGYEDIKNELFVPPVKVGRRSFVPSDELAALIDARIAGKDDESIRTLVRSLCARRSGVKVI